MIFKYLSLSTNDTSIVTIYWLTIKASFTAFVLDFDKISTCYMIFIFVIIWVFVIQLASQHNLAIIIAIRENKLIKTEVFLMLEIIGGGPPQW